MVTKKKHKHKSSKCDTVNVLAKVVNQMVCAYPSPLNYAFASLLNVIIRK